MGKTTEKQLGLKRSYDFDAVTEAVTVLAVNEPITPPPLLWGGIGVGKTTFCETLAAQLGMSFYQLPASHIDPALLHGIPIADTKASVTAFLPPEFVAADKTFLLIDEVNTAPESVIAAVMETIRTRRIGRKVYADLKVVLAANPPQLAAGGFSMPLPLRNRVVHIDWKLPLTHFRLVTALPPFDRKVEHTTAALPIADMNEIRKWWSWASGIVDAFLNKFPHLYYEEDTIERGDAYEFGTPRTWDYVKVILAVFRSVNASPSALAVAILGTVGDAAQDFFTFMTESGVPHAEEILNDPTILLNLRADVFYISVFALTSFLAQNPDKDVVEKFFDVISFLISRKKHDYAMLLLDSVSRMIRSGVKLVIPLRKLSEAELNLLQRIHDITAKLGGGKNEQ